MKLPFINRTIYQAYHVARRYWDKMLLVACVTPVPAFAMQVQEIPQDSIVSVAYGFQHKDRVTAAISSVSGEELRKTHTPNLNNALMGRLPGLTILHSGTAPGEDEPSVFFRGRHTFQNNRHLIIVDGIWVNANSASNISPDEIESVSILKDAAALAQFGVKGANGVIWITTKRGSVREGVNINLNARYGAQLPTALPSVSGSYDFARLYNQALANDGLPPAYSASQLEGYREGSDPYLYPDVNWYNEVLRKQTPLHDYSLTFDGGNNTAKYFVMLGYLDNRGLYAHTDQEHNANTAYQRVNFRANVDLNITRGLSAEIALGGNIRDWKFPPISTGNMWQYMATYAPNLYPVRTPEGQITGTATFPYNPIGYLLEGGYQSRHDRNIQSRVRLTQQLNLITPGLDVFGAILFDNEFNNRYDKTRQFAYYEPISTTSSTGADSVYFLQRGLDTDLTVSTGGNYENNRTIFQIGSNYQRTFGKHAMDAMLMYQLDKYTVLANPAPFAMQNFSGRLTYDYSGKYVAEFGFSYSGTENYPPGKRMGFFPALSAAWLLHKEDFWKPNQTVNYLKLRASAGMVGNDAGAARFNYNQYWGTQSSQGYYFGTGSTFYNALVQLGMANPQITWEKAFLYGAGADVGLFGNKLNVTADFFYENRTDILVNSANFTPALAGYAAGAMENKGQVTNYGTEIGASYRHASGAVEYVVGGDFAFAKNRIKALYEVPRKEAYSVRENHPVGQFFGLEAIGFFRDESDIAASPIQTFSNVQPGDLKYKDQNNDNLIDINDEVAIGRQNYPEITFALHGGCTFRGFNLDVFFQGITNRSVYLNNYLFRPFVDNANILSWAAEGHWTPENHARATFPRLTTEPNANNYYPSTFWVRDANILRLRNVELGYTFSNDLLQKLRLSTLKLYVSGLNLFSWSDLNVDVDPETLSAGYPVMKTYSAGITVKF